jgi:hypothetical protein
VVVHGGEAAAGHGRVVAVTEVGNRHGRAAAVAEVAVGADEAVAGRGRVAIVTEVAAVAHYSHYKFTATFTLAEHLHRQRVVISHVNCPHSHLDVE